MSRLYEQLCKRCNKLIGLEDAQIKERQKNREKKYKEKQQELKEEESNLKKYELLHGEDSKKYRNQKNKTKKKKKEFERAKKNHFHENFRNAVFFTGMDLTYDEVLNFSVFLSLVSFFISLIGAITCYYLLNLSVLSFLAYTIPVLTAIPSIVLWITANYPEMLEKRLKTESLGKAPNIINYMTMSLRVNPSLNRAIIFSANNTKEPMKRSLNNIIWRVYLREKSSIEESFLEYALKWGEWNNNLKRALYAVRSATLEKGHEAFNNSIERANTLIIEGTKQKVRKYTKSLKTPTTILFSIGILLPMIVGAMLPMMSLGVLDIGSINSQTSHSSPLNFPLIFLIMDIAAPLGAFLFSYKILGDRPGTTTPPTISIKENKKEKFAISLIIGFFILAVAVFLDTNTAVMTPILMLSAVIFPFSFYCFSTSIKQRKKKMKILKMEKDFPDTLFQIGSRVAEGNSLESAIKKTSIAMKNSSMGKLLRSISYNIHIKNSSLKRVLFSDDGLLKDHPSDLIKASMRTIVEITKKDPEKAGKTIVQIANFTQDMQKMDEELKTELSQSVEMMRATALFFAPIIMGVVSVLYFLLEDVFTDISSVQMIKPGLFSFSLGLYLFLISIAITYFITGIKHRIDITEFKYNLGIITSTSHIIFLITMTACSTFIL